MVTSLSSSLELAPYIRSKPVRVSGAAAEPSGAAVSLSRSTETATSPLVGSCDTRIR